MEWKGGQQMVGVMLRCLQAVGMAGAKASAGSLHMNKEVWEHSGSSSLSEGLDLKGCFEHTRGAG